MILHNLEQITEQCLNQSNNDPTKIALLQSYYFNLTNLKKTIANDQINKIQKSVNIRPSGHGNQNEDNSLPMLSILHLNNSSSINHEQVGDYGKKTFPNSLISHKNINETSLLHKFSRQNSLCRQLSDFSNFSLKNVHKKLIPKLKSENQQNKASASSSQSSLSNNKRKNNFRTKLKTNPKNLFLHKNSLTKQQRYFEHQDVIVSEEIVEKIGLYQAAQLFKNKNINKFIDEQYSEKMKPVLNLRFASISACPKDQLFLTENSYCPTLNDADQYSELMGCYEIKQKEKQKMKEKEKGIEQRKKNKVVDNMSQRYSNQTIFNELDQIMQKQQAKAQSVHENYQLSNRTFWILNIHNYVLMKNQQYFCLKSQNIEDWNQISFILNQILSYLKSIKISHLSFKFDKQLFLKQLWCARKIQSSKIQSLLNIRLGLKKPIYNLPNPRISDSALEAVKNPAQKIQTSKMKRKFLSRVQIIHELIRLWKDRKNLQMKKKEKRKRNQILIRLCLRIILKHRMCGTKNRKIQRVLDLNKRFREGLWKADVQIYLPSFSESQFIRNTTQYMQTYENMFYHLWSSSTKHIILILPAVNEILLKKFQEKIKVNKNITIICPDSHQIYPKNMPLAAYLLYSKDSINRIKSILQNRKGIIIPGRRLNYSMSSDRLDYQINLSDLLMIPLYCNLEKELFPYLNSSSQLASTDKIISKNLIDSQKQTINDQKMFIDAHIKTLKSRYIPPNSHTQFLVDQLSQLLIDNKHTKKWLLKLNGEFNGRGIAIFDASSSKKLKDIILFQYVSHTSEQSGKKQYKISNKIKDQLKSRVRQYLETYFRLKLTVNFQNCIYRVQQYISKFLKHGGFIEEYLEDCQTYQLCYKIEPGDYKLIKKQSESLLNSNTMLGNAYNKVWTYHTNKYIAICQNYQIDFVTKLSIFQNASQVKNNEELLCFADRAKNMLVQNQYLGYVSIIGLYSHSHKAMYGLQIKKYMTLNSSISQYLGAMKKIQSKLLRQMSISPNNSYLDDDSWINDSKSGRKKDAIQSIIEDSSERVISNNEIEIVSLFIPTIIFTDVDEVTRSELIQNLILEQEQILSESRRDDLNINKALEYPFQIYINSQKNSRQICPKTTFGINYLSLGLSLGLLLYGNKNELKKMKKVAIERLRNISQRVDLCKMYRGKQEIRDVYRFGDVIRALSKIQ